jgi:hypothetical protein
MDLLQTHYIFTAGVAESVPASAARPKRKIEADILTDDHIRQMLGHVGANFQADYRKRKRTDIAASLHRLN